MKPFAESLLVACTQLATGDWEDNAVQAVQVASELHKVYRTSLEKSASSFVDVALRLYRDFDQAVAFHFGDGGAGEGAAAGAEEGADVPAGLGGPSRTHVPASRSFKVLVDLPLPLMFLLQLYPAISQRALASLLRPMLDCVLCESLPAGPTSLSASARGAYGDMRAAQVKTVSFITFLLRSHAEEFRPFAPRLARAVVFLLRTCPDRVSVRKELLVAARHMLSNPMLRVAFLDREQSHADLLLREEVLLGPGLASRDSLRLLSFSLVSEMVSPAASLHAAPAPSPPALAAAPSPAPMC